MDDSSAPGRGGGTEGRTHGDVVTLSDVGAQDAGDHAAEVQQGHAAAPAVVRGRLALQAGEAEESAATWGGGRNNSTSCPKQKELGPSAGAGTYCWKMTTWLI